MRCSNCNSCNTRVGWVGLVASVLIGVFTIVMGILSDSKALMAVSLCLGVDIATSLTVIFGLKISSKPVDLEHPYGHGKIESVAVGGISVLLILSAVILFFSSIKSIYHGAKGPEQIITLVVALVAALATEIKYRYAICVGRHFNSPAIISHAEHARVDVISALAVVVAVIGARSGLHFVDPLIAIFEVGHIFKASSKMLISSIKSLMDVSISDEKISSIKNIVSAVNGVKNINYLRARQIGRHIWIDLSIFIDPDITIFEGKNISENVKNYLTNKLESIGNVHVHFLSSRT
ncbi:cation diffusion facilitator family transporter [candidate division KSB1 bacterium]